MASWHADLPICWGLPTTWQESGRASPLATLRRLGLLEPTEQNREMSPEQHTQWPRPECSTRPTAISQRLPPPRRSTLISSSVSQDDTTNEGMSRPLTERYPATRKQQRWLGDQLLHNPFLRRPDQRFLAGGIVSARGGARKRRFTGVLAGTRLPEDIPESADECGLMMFGALPRMANSIGPSSIVSYTQLIRVSGNRRAEPVERAADGRGAVGDPLAKKRHRFSLRSGPLGGGVGRDHR